MVWGEAASWGWRKWQGRRLTAACLLFCVLGACGVEPPLSESCLFKASREQQQGKLAPAGHVLFLFELSPQHLSSGTLGRLLVSSFFLCSCDTRGQLHTVLPEVLGLRSGRKASEARLGYCSPFSWPSWLFYPLALTPASGQQRFLGMRVWLGPWEGRSPAAGHWVSWLGGRHSLLHRFAGC